MSRLGIGLTLFISLPSLQPLSGLLLDKAFVQGKRQPTSHCALSCHLVRFDLCPSDLPEPGGGCLQYGICGDIDLRGQSGGTEIQEVSGSDALHPLQLHFLCGIDGRVLRFGRRGHEGSMRFQAVHSAGEFTPILSSLFSSLD